MRGGSIFVFVFAVFLISLVSASFQFSEEGSSVISIYQINDTLEASLNISFSNEPLNSTFQDSIGNSIKLEDLLESNKDYVTFFDDITNTTVSSAFQNLNFNEAGFKMDKPIGNITYKLSLERGTVFEITFQILSNKNLIEQTLDEKYSQLNDSKTEIMKQDIFIQNILIDFLNISENEEELIELARMYEDAQTSEEYMEINENLSKIKIPKTISEIISTDSISFYPSQENINLNVLQEIGGGSYGNDREGYIGAIYNWNDVNVKTTLTFREISIGYSASDQITLRIFRFEFDKTNMIEDGYFIIEKFQDMKFEGTPAPTMQESSSGYLYANLKQIPNTLLFSTTQNVDFLSVPAFISPSLSDLTLPEPIGKLEEWIDNSKIKWILFAVIVFIVLLIGVITYILVHVWYRKKYEAHLFKTRNNLFNIMTYIQNAKKKEMPREEIMKNLRKAGWTGEQIEYAMRKYEGKKILGLVRNPLNLTPETEKKVEMKSNPGPKLPPHNPPPITKPFNPNQPLENKPDQDNQNKNTKV